MLNKIKSIIFFLVLISFLLSILIFYFSDENKMIINSNRFNLKTNFNIKQLNLPVLKNDTNDVIEYPKENENNEKSKKRYFWKLLN
tara:strand:- start:11143 stop:11400 length:258 start_codon:yes stop_codon:yes gene_type:complete